MDQGYITTEARQDASKQESIQLELTNIEDMLGSLDALLSGLKEDLAPILAAENKIMPMPDSIGVIDNDDSPLLNRVQRIYRHAEGLKDGVIYLRRRVQL